jgi:hypothetical protein
MKTRNFNYLMALVFFGMVVMVSCKKEDNSTVAVTKEDGYSVAQDVATAGDSYDEVYNESDEVVALEEGNKYANSSDLKSASATGTRKVTVTKGGGDSTVYPKTITIEYTNWVGKNGRKKNGTITITQSAKMWKAGAIRTITLTAFVINDSIKIEGVKTITNKGLVNGKPTIEVKLEDGKVTNLNTAKYVSCEFTRTRTWSQGFDTPLWIWDDIYTITGSASGINKKGLSYTSTISETNPLEIKVGCPWIRKGTITIVIEASKTVVIDFGSGSCDKKFSVTVDGEAKEDSSASGSETTGL